MVRTHPIEQYQALRDSVLCLSRAATPPEGHQIGARKKRAPGNIILSQSHCRRVSTDRMNREDSQLAASLEGEPGPTPAGNTLPHSYPVLGCGSFVRGRKRKKGDSIPFILPRRDYMPRLPDEVTW